MASENDTDTLPWPLYSRVEIDPAKESEAIYKPLSADHVEIRLMSIYRPKFPNDVPRCKVWSERLDTNRPYYAVSYVWGDSNRNSTIVVNGTITQVTANLDAVLRTLTDLNYVKTPLWIDAICINQNDIVERGHQVRVMGQIFQNATQVLACLDIKEPCPGAYIHLAKREPEPDSLPRSLKKEVTSTLRKILSQAWWTRRWIIQEAVLAKDLIFICADNIIPWQKLRISCERWLSEPEDLAVVGRSIRLSSLRAAWNPNLEHEKSLTIWSALVRCRGQFDAREPVDHVYALLGIVTNADWIQPDYSKTLKEVSRDIVLRRLATVPQSLMFLQQCESGAGPTYDHPTWVPSWDCERMATIKRKNCGRLSEEAFRSIYNVPNPTVEENGKVLVIHGTVLDEVFDRRAWNRNLWAIRGKMSVQKCICSENAMRGDLICWFRHSQAFILRKFEEGFVFIGPCTVEQYVGTDQELAALPPREFRIY